MDQTVCTNPATGEVIGYSLLNTPEDVRQTVATARAAQTAWASPRADGPP